MMSFQKQPLADPTRRPEVPYDHTYLGPMQAIFAATTAREFKVVASSVGRGQVGEPDDVRTLLLEAVSPSAGKISRFEAVTVAVGVKGIPLETTVQLTLPVRGWRSLDNTPALPKETPSYRLASIHVQDWQLELGA